MANWTQEDGAAEPATKPADVSTTAQISSGNVTTKLDGNPAPVPCLIPSFADAVKLLDARYSCLVLDTHRRHILLPPVYMRKKRSGIQEELNAELLKYSKSLNGVPMAYDSIKIIGQNGDIYDDQGFIHFDIEASFVTFRPQIGSKLVGVINKLGIGHVGCLVHGCFNASVMKPGLLTPEQWRDCGLSVGQSLEFEVFQLDADTAGVLLIRGRLKKSRVQELMGETVEQESTTVAEVTEDTTDSPKPKKKKKKDKREKECAADGSVNDSSLWQLSDNNESTVDTTEVDSNSNRHHKEKKKKKKKDKQQELDEILPSELPASDSSGYVSDKTSGKRAAESEDGLQDASETMPPAKKKKKHK